MADISITPVAPRVFRVEVREGQGARIHQVTVPERLGETLELGEGDLERVVRESFGFLLEREPATSILRQFSLSDISRYFPEYPSELERRLS
jgi:bifunctional DNA-binding transcriptional regulator/antitoxin component of YhaV-PrlF toxin-antitoxin module